jgi:hypothetical protein
MDCLQISGAPHTGKTMTIFQLYTRYTRSPNRNFTIIHEEPAPIVAAVDNMRAVLQHPTSGRRLLLNSRSDYAGNGQELIDYYQRHSPIEILVTSIRDQGPERNAMEAAIRSVGPGQTVEVPLAKVTRRINWNAAAADYWARVERLCVFILEGQPFDLL